LHDHISAASVFLAIDVPDAGVTVRFADRALACRHGDEFEVGMVREPPHEALAYNARGSENCRFQFGSWGISASTAYSGSIAGKLGRDRRGFIVILWGNTEIGAL
jgi:hypothetical protein